MATNQNIYKDTQQVTAPSKEVYSVTKSIVVDSRQRNCARYKNPAFYTLDLDYTFKNITSIELKGAIFPKSSYNIHTSNNKIDFVVGDFITSFHIIDGGAGYTQHLL
jgi:predicted porin